MKIKTTMRYLLPHIHQNDYQKTNKQKTEITSTGEDIEKLEPCIAAQDGGALQSQQKQDRELTVAQIMSTLLQNSGIN